jgi:hypothetical protein
VLIGEMIFCFAKIPIEFLFDVSHASSGFYFSDLVYCIFP